MPTLIIKANVLNMIEYTNGRFDAMDKKKDVSSEQFMYF